MNKLIILVFSGVLLQGCLGNKNEIKSDVVYLQSIPTCHSDDVCKKMWVVAADWVDQYSPQGIEVYSNTLIQSEEQDLGSDEMYIEIKKVKHKDNSFKIVIDNMCNRSGGGCSVERNNMIAFNKKLIGLMSVKERKIKEKVLKVNSDINHWAKKYVGGINKFDASLITELFHLPTTLIEKDSVLVLNTKSDVSTFLTQLKLKFENIKGQYINVDEIDVFARTGRNLYVNIVFNVYDAENALVASQQRGLHFVLVDNQLKMISSGLHTQ